MLVLVEEYTDEANIVIQLREKQLSVVIEGLVYKIIDCSMELTASTSILVEYINEVSSISWPSWTEWILLWEWEVGSQHTAVSVQGIGR